MAPLLTRSAALMLFSADGREVRFATSAGAELIAEGITEQARNRLILLADGLAPLSGVRLERLEFTGVGFVTCACRRLRTGQETSGLLVAALPVAQAQPTVAGPASVESATTLVSAEPEAVTLSEPVRKADPLPERLRVLWETSSDGALTSLSGNAARVFGDDFVERVLGRTWSELSRDVIQDVDGQIASALAREATWGALLSFWRIGAGSEAYRVLMSGYPRRDQSRQFTGFGGFALVDTTARFTWPEQPRSDMGDSAVPAGDTPVGEAHATLAPGAEGEGGPWSQPPAGHADDAISEVTASTPPPMSEDETPARTNAAAGNVVTLPLQPRGAGLSLSRNERNAFREIAKALGARIEGDDRQRAPEQAQHAVPPGRDVPANEDHAPEMTAAAPEEVDSTVSGVATSDADSVAIDAPDEAARQPDVAGQEQLAEKVEAVAAPTIAPSPETVEPETVRTSADIIPLLPAPRVMPADPGFPELVGKLPIGVLVLQEERVAFANQTLIDLLEYDSLEELAAAGVDRVFAVGNPEQPAGVITLKRKDGAHESVDARLTSIEWNAAPATMIAFRRAVETLDQARLDALKLDVARAKGQVSELSAILDTATDGVATLDERGRLLSLNKSAEALFGYDQREVVGENFTLLLAPESHLTALDYLQGIKGDGVASLLNDGRDVTGRVRQGGRIPLFMTMGRVSEGEEHRYSIVLRDMTSWKQAEAELVEARRAAERASAQKSDVLAKISHEIRTPLNAIIGFTEVMSEERFGPIGNERYKEYLHDIHQSGAYLISLVNDLLDLAKIEAGKMDLNFTGVSLNEIASSAVSLMQTEAGRQRVVLRTGLQAKLPQVVADERSIRQIVINLLSNAVKFTDAGGQVIVSTSLSDRGDVVLRVRDTGIGMTEKELSQAMEPFRQVAATRRGNGTGLGLPITRALVEANKGALAITSVKNEGTLVEITFPPQRVLAS